MTNENTRLGEALQSFAELLRGISIENGPEDLASPVGGEPSLSYRVREKGYDEGDNECIAETRG
jgi:hypothetical protein